MSTEYNPDLSHVPQLSTERWQQAHEQAIKVIRASVQPPDRQHYISQRITNAHGPLFYLMLFAVMLAAFWISAGKQIIGAASLIDPLTSQARLSAGWGDWAIALTLAFGELGSLVFMIAVGSAANVTKQRVFLSFALLCAAVALIANISVTASHVNQEYLAFDILLTVLPPLTVLGVGLILEDDLMKSSRQKAQHEAAYQSAREEFERVQTDPESAPNFKKVWAKAVYNELRHYKRDREWIEALTPDEKYELVHLQFHIHELWDRYEVAAPHPALLAASMSMASKPVLLAPGEDNAPKAESKAPASTQTASTPREQARKLLDEHPEWANISAYKLAEMTGLSKDAFTRARRGSAR